MPPNAKAEDPFGIGGSSPADLNPFLDPDARHTEMLRKMHEQVARLTRETDLQQEDFAALMGSLENQRNLLTRTPSIYPVKGELNQLRHPEIAVYRRIRISQGYRHLRRERNRGDCPRGRPDIQVSMRDPTASSW